MSSAQHDRALIDRTQQTSLYLYWKWMRLNDYIISLFFSWFWNLECAKRRSDFGWPIWRQWRRKWRQLKSITFSAKRIRFLCLSSCDYNIVINHNFHEWIEQWNIHAIIGGNQCSYQSYESSSHLPRHIRFDRFARWRLHVANFRFCFSVWDYCAWSQLLVESVYATFFFLLFGISIISFVWEFGWRFVFFFARA